MEKGNLKSNNPLNMMENLIMGLFREKETFNGLMEINMKVSSKQGNCMAMGHL